MMLLSLGQGNIIESIEVILSILMLTLKCHLNMKCVNMQTEFWIGFWTDKKNTKI